MTPTLIVASQRLEPAEVQALTRDLVASINDHTDVRAEIAQGETRAGERGDAVTLGAIVLSFVTSGAAVALIQVFKAYFERDEGLEISLERPDGRKLTIKSENVSGKRIDEALASAREFFGDASAGS